MDKVVEDVIIEMLKIVYFDYVIFVEELGEFDNEFEFKWIIDLFDGMINFIYGFLYYCVLIVFEYKGVVM